jgi:hypothetical protein
VADPVADWKMTIRERCGLDIDPAGGAVLSATASGGIVATALDRYWDQNADRALGDLRLQAAYTLRDCVDALLSSAPVQTGIRVSVGGDSFNNEQWFDHLAAVRANAQLEIADTVRRLGRARGAVAASLAATEPSAPDRLTPISAFDPAFAGSPYSRRRRPF